MTKATLKIPQNNRLVECRKPHAELLDLHSGAVWQSHRPISRQAYEALDLPEGLLKVGLGCGVMDEHYFRRSPGSEVDGAVSERVLGGELWIHCAAPPKDGPEFPVGDDPRLLRVDKHHSLIFDAGREVDVIRVPDGRDFIQVVAASPKGRGLFQPTETAEAAVESELVLPSDWQMRSERFASRTVVHLPHPTEAWFFKNGASFQGPVKSFTVPAA